MSFAVWPRERGPVLPSNVSAVVASHGCANVCAEKIQCPIMYTSGSGDRKASRKCWPSYDDSLFAPSKVWASVNGAHHMSPEQSGQLNPYTADFLGCHLAAHDYQASCDRIYGNGADDMCQTSSIDLDGCEAVKDNKPPPPAQCDFVADVDLTLGANRGSTRRLPRKCAATCAPWTTLVPQLSSQMVGAGSSRKISSQSLQHRQGQWLAHQKVGLRCHQHHHLQHQRRQRHRLPQRFATSRRTRIAEEISMRRCKPMISTRVAISAKLTRTVWPGHIPSGTIGAKTCQLAI